MKMLSVLVLAIALTLVVGCAEDPRARLMSEFPGTEVQEIIPPEKVILPIPPSAIFLDSPLVAHSDCQIFPDILTSYTAVVSFTVIDIKTQHLACYEYGQLARICDICTAKQGEDGFEDLIGDWQVLRHSQDAKSSIWFDDEGKAFAMPYAVAIGGGYWIHQGELPGYPASHGCIRLRPANARWYFHWAKKEDAGCSYQDFNQVFGNQKKLMAAN